MMFCQKCVTKLIDGQCPRCNPAAEVKPPKEQEIYGNALPYINLYTKTSNSDEVENFLSFKTMLTPTQIKSIYLPVSIIIIVGMLIAMLSGGVAMFFLGLTTGAILLVVFRFACEILLSLSSINEKLNEADGKSEAKGQSIP